MGGGEVEETKEIVSECVKPFVLLAGRNIKLDDWETITLPSVAKIGLLTPHAVAKRIADGSCQICDLPGGCQKEIHAPYGSATVETLRA